MRAGPVTSVLSSGSSCWVIPVYHILVINDSSLALMKLHVHAVMLAEAFATCPAHHCVRIAEHAHVQAFAGLKFIYRTHTNVSRN